MNNFKTIWLAGWMAVACLTLAFGWRADDSSAPSINITATSSQAPSSVNIEDLRVGDRVMGVQSGAELDGKTLVDESTWKKLRLYTEIPWDDGTVDDINVETLQPPEWLSSTDAEVGAAVPLPLDLTEMGLPDSLRAKVVSIDPCPAIEEGPGRVVLTTVNHLNRFLFDLSFVSPAGQEESVRTTGWHKFYRQDDNAWVSAVDLKEGDRLVGVHGPLVVQSLTRVVGVHRVYNMTVEGEHVYRVAHLGVLVHNNGCAHTQPDKIDELVAAAKPSQRNLAPIAPKSKPTTPKSVAKKPVLDPTKPAQEVLPGSLKRKFPSQHLGKSLDEIRNELRTATGVNKQSLQTAKKLLEQSERLLNKK